MAYNKMRTQNNSARYRNKSTKDISKKSIAPKKTQIPVNNKKDIDYTFFFFIILMVCVGMVMLLSASTPAANTKFGNSYYFFLKQLAFVIIGLVGMGVISRVDYNVYKKYIPHFMAICIILLLLVAIPGIGVKRNGSRRWLPLPGIQLQPSEFMKLAIGMYFAFLVDKQKWDVTKMKGLIPYLGIITVVGLLMIAEPHLSGAIVISGIAITIMVVAGAPIKPFAIGLATILPFGTFIIYKIDPVRWARITRFLDPFQDMQKTGYQISQGLYAIGSGGIFGRGLGQSIQKYSYLPEPYNDFIFAVVCEELGLIGATLIIALFGMLILRGIKIALNAPDTFATLTVVGIMAQIAIQTTLNIAVATASVPNTGVSLPFFSYGGTAIMVLLFEMGIVLNISRYSMKNEFTIK